MVSLTPNTLSVYSYELHIVICAPLGMLLVPGDTLAFRIFHCLLLILGTWNSLFRMLTESLMIPEWVIVVVTLVLQILPVFFIKYLLL